MSQYSKIKSVAPECDSAFHRQRNLFEFLALFIRNTYGNEANLACGSCFLHSKVKERIRDFKCLDYRLL